MSADQGCQCACGLPHCPSYVTKKPLDSSIVFGLKEMLRRSGQNPVHINRKLSQKGTGHKVTEARHWDLIEKCGPALYRVTDLGRSFVEDGERVPKFVETVAYLDGKRAVEVGTEGPLVNCEECMGDKR